MRLSANTVIEVYKKTKPAKYQAPAISEEALKGKWYAYSIIKGDKPEAYYYSSNDGKATYIDLKNAKKFDGVSYDSVDGVFGGNPTNLIGTWKYEDSNLIITITVSENNVVTYNNISLQNEILTMTNVDSGYIEKYRKTPPAKLE